MAPEFRLQDTLIVDPDTKPKPGDFVAAKLDGEEEILIRKYKQLSGAATFQEFELIAFNEDWGNIRINNNGNLIGTLVNLNRLMK